jgi:hypothetical protein
MGVGHSLESTNYLAMAIGRYDLDIKPGAVRPDQNGTDG